MIARSSERGRRRRNDVLNSLSTHMLSGSFSGLSVVSTGNEERHVRGSVMASLLQLLDRVRESTGRKRKKRRIVDQDLS